MHTKMKGPLQNSYRIKLLMHVKMMFTKMFSELQHVIDDMMPSLGAVAVTVEGPEDPPVVRPISCQTRGDDEVLKERMEEGDHLFRKTQCACEPREKTPYIAKRESVQTGGARG